MFKFQPYESDTICKHGKVTELVIQRLKPAKLSCDIFARELHKNVSEYISNCVILVRVTYVIRERTGKYIIWSRMDLSIYIG